MVLGGGGENLTRTVTILGSTGVIGINTLEVIDHLNAMGDDVRVVALAAGGNFRLLADQIRRYRPLVVSVTDEATAKELRLALPAGAKTAEVFIGEDGLREVAKLSSDTVVSAIVGAKGLVPTWEALQRGATIALANKETLVAAGDLVMPVAHSKNVQILPVDSEHSALFQALKSGRSSEVARYFVTASGGPFRTWDLERLSRATVDEALRHPNWVMGQKITIDSASLMNKGLEVIEAHHLFQASYDKIEVVVHPQSVIHSMVEFVDGSVIAQLATADMRLPIQYALTHDTRLSAPWPRLDVFQMSGLTFEHPDAERFPSLRLAYAAGRAGGFAPCVLNAANEVAVGAFLARRISFLGMAKLVESVLEIHSPGTPTSISEVLVMDGWARAAAEAKVQRGGW